MVNILCWIFGIGLLEGRITKGKRGRYRWRVTDPETAKTIGICTAAGYKTETLAREACQKITAGRVTFK